MKAADMKELLEKAKTFAMHSFVPYSGRPIGALALTSDNIIFGGCEIENLDIACSVSAAEVAVFKAVSEGHIEIKAVAIYAAGEKLRFPSSKARQTIFQFGKNADVIIGSDEDYEVYKAYELLPFNNGESDDEI